MTKPSGIIGGDRPRTTLAADWPGGLLLSWRRSATITIVSSSRLVSSAGGNLYFAENHLKEYFSTRKRHCEVLKPMAEATYRRAGYRAIQGFLLVDRRCNKCGEYPRGAGNIIANPSRQILSWLWVAKDSMAMKPSKMRCASETLRREFSASRRTNM